MLDANKSGEAYTENGVGHRDYRDPEALVSPRKQLVSTDEGCNAPEVQAKRPLKVRLWRVGGVIKPWHASRDALGTWEAQIVPEGSGRAVKSRGEANEGSLGVGLAHIR